MRRVSLFVEDSAQEAFLIALVNRYAESFQEETSIDAKSVRGGSGKAVSELKHYLRDIRREMLDKPDLLIVGRDANCKGYNERKNELDEATGENADLGIHFIYAIPDPHLERWLLLDSSAFESVLGRGCSAPDQKCERNRYKNLLIDAIKQAGVTPLLGGQEYAEDIVRVMDLHRMEKTDKSLGKLINSLDHAFRSWKE